MPHPEQSVGIRMDKEVRERFDQVMQALHEVDKKVTSVLGWSHDYQDHNSKDKVAMKAETARVEAKFDTFRQVEHIPLSDSFSAFRTTIYIAVIALLLSITGYLLVNDRPWVKSAEAQTK